MLTGAIKIKSRKSLAQKEEIKNNLTCRHKKSKKLLKIKKFLNILIFTIIKNS